MNQPTQQPEPSATPITDAAKYPTKAIYYAGNCEVKEAETFAVLAEVAERLERELTALRRDKERLEREATELRRTLEHIAGYVNGHFSYQAAFHACQSMARAQLASAPRQAGEKETS